MKCSDIQFDLTFYSDGSLGEKESSAVETHLGTCPLCREAHTEYLEMATSLRKIRRPEASLALKNKINEAIRSDVLAARLPASAMRPDIFEWLQMRVMPYGVGVFASVLVAVGFLGMMFNGMLQPPVDRAKNGETTVMLAADRDPYMGLDPLETVPTTEFARSRMEFASESPSVNPQGALIALTKSFVRGGMKDDEVVVVADVFSNGLAKVAEVVEPSHNARAVFDLERALQSDPAFAPFVPSGIESRPESVRVVLKFQSVNVDTNPRRARTRL